MTANSTKTDTLYARIARVQAQLEPIKATGTNAFRSDAISIDDVENTLRTALGNAGIVTRWSYVDLSAVDERTWRAHLRVTVVNAEDREDHFEDEWIDVGGNPMAATSFARKGYLKALFHLSEPSDEGGSTPTGHTTRVPSQTARRPASNSVPSDTAAAPPSSNGRTVCPLCKEQGYKTRSGKPPTFYQSHSDNALVCNGISGKDEAGNEVYAKHSPEPTEADKEAAAEAPGFDYENVQGGYAPAEATS